MNKCTFTDGGYTFERISKTAARIAYKNGLSVMVCPVNSRPGAPYHREIVLNRKNREQFTVDEIGVENDFENLINSFEYYNCINNETGKYAAFYIPVKLGDRFTGEVPTADTLGTVKQYDYSYIGG